MYKKEDKQNSLFDINGAYGSKLDLSIDEYGNARIEKMSFDVYNKSEILKIKI